MRLRRSLTPLLGIALLGTAPPAPPPVAAPPADTSPLRCHRGESDGGRVVVTGTRVRRGMTPPVVYAPAAPPAPPPPPPPPPPPAVVAPAPIVSVPVAPAVGRTGYVTAADRERYRDNPVAPAMRVAEAPVSTFSVDVDTASYANVRRLLNAGQRPPADAVRTEELVNYFRYDYPRPTSAAEPFSVTTAVTRTPWNPATRLLRIGLRADTAAADRRPPANIVFLVDVSGSMMEPAKLPLVKAALSMLADRLGPQDRVSIVAYAGNAGLVLAPTNDKRYVRAALDCLEAGGSTAGGAGIRLAYATARTSFVRGGVNRIFLATDGDFNVGTTSDKALEEMVKHERDDGITLTTLGFGTGNYNDAMMERIADAGNGNYAYIDTATEARKVLDDQLAATLVTVAQDVKIQVEFNPAAIAQYRLIGYEDRALAEQDFADDRVDAGDIGAGHQVTALYEVVPAGAAGWLPGRRYPANRPAAAASPVGARECADVRLRYKLPGETRSRLIERPVPAAAIAAAQPPRGDAAFAAAVAAYGQALRGDTRLDGFSFAQARALAGPQTDFTRQEFLSLTRLAEATNRPGAN